MSLPIRLHRIALLALSPLSVAVPMAWPQSPPVNPPASSASIAADTATELRVLAARAGIIFTGIVTAVRTPQTPAGAASSPPGIVEIDFAVTDAIRGVAGPAYTLREWAGLWSSANQPFHPGERYLMLLHAPSPAGLSSPVGGPDGAIPLRAGDQPDLRWIAARTWPPQTEAANPSLAAVLALLRAAEPDAAR